MRWHDAGGGSELRDLNHAKLCSRVHPTKNAPACRCALHAEGVEFAGCRKVESALVLAGAERSESEKFSTRRSGWLTGPCLPCVQRHAALRYLDQRLATKRKARKVGKDRAADILLACLQRQASGRVWQNRRF